MTPHYKCGKKQCSEENKHTHIGQEIIIYTVDPAWCSVMIRLFEISNPDIANLILKNKPVIENLVRPSKWT